MSRVEPVLVTGAGGQLGQAMIRQLGDRRVVGLDRRALDITDRAAVREAVEAIAPTAIVNCAAMTNVDACETDIEMAMSVNAWAVRVLAEAADAHGAHLVQVSTDYVFDGTKAEPYHEWDATGPRSVYGRSKLGGESEVGRGGTVARTAWLFGLEGANIVTTIMRLAEAGTPLRFVDDQWGTPTFAEDLAATLVTLVDERLPGVYHVTNAGETNWFGFAGDVLELAGYSRDQVEPVSTAELTPVRPAPRPANSRLANLALEKAGVGSRPHYRQALEQMIAELRR